MIVKDISQNKAGNKIAKIVLRISCLVLLYSMLLISCGKKDVGRETELVEHHHEESNTVVFTKAQSQMAGIELGKVEPKQIGGTIKVSGMLDVPPQQLVSISAPLGGFLKNTTMLQGSKVKKGEHIATIENLDFIQLQQDYLEAKSQMELAKADYDRQQELAKENVNSQKTLQQAKAHYVTWHARYSGLHEKLKVINIRINDIEAGNLKSSINLYSPIDGFVTQVNVNIGKFVNPTDVLFEIVDTRHLHAELIVFEKDVLKLKIGQKVRFILANETKERIATVYLIGREISQDRTIRVHCHINEQDNELLPGMYLTALVETEASVVPALPNEAIVDYQGKKYIFTPVQENNQINKPGHEDKENSEANQYFVIREIKPGNSELGYTEVNLPDSVVREPVVIKGAYSLLSKMKNKEDEGEGH